MVKWAVVQRTMQGVPILKGILSPLSQDRAHQPLKQKDAKVDPLALSSIASYFTTLLYGSMIFLNSTIGSFSNPLHIPAESSPHLTSPPPWPSRILATHHITIESRYQRMPSLAYGTFASLTSSSKKKKENITIPTACRSRRQVQHQHRQHQQITKSNGINKKAHQ